MSDLLQKVLIDEANTLLVWKQRAYVAEARVSELQAEVASLRDPAEAGEPE